MPNEQSIPANVTSWWPATAQAGTPPDAISLINKWFVEVVSTNETRQHLVNLRDDAFVTTPQDAQKLMLEDIEDRRGYVKVANIKLLG